MKITDVRTMLLHGPDPHGVGGVERTWDVLLVRIDTDGGVYGLGEAGAFMGDREAIAYAREWLIGRDPLAIGPFIRAMLSGGLPPYEPQMSPTATVDGPIVFAARPRDSGGGRHAAATQTSDGPAMLDGAIARSNGRFAQITHMGRRELLPYLHHAAL